MCYPDELLRGIPGKNFVGDDYYPTSDLFYFKKRENQPNRSDGLLAVSINWKDDDEALVLLFKQTKDNGSIQFKSGTAVLSRSELDHLINSPSVKQHKLLYERQKLPKNKYHGNLLLGNQVPKSIMKRIAASIATTCVIEIIGNPYYDKTSN